MISRHVPPVIYLPEEALEECRAYLESHLAFRLHGQEIEEMLPSYRLVGVRGGQKVRLTGKGHTDKLCEIFQCHHSVPCVGYGFLQEKKRLKAEYAGVPGRQLGALRKQGVALDEPFESPMFLFMGDTTVQFFEEQLELEGKGKENVFRYPLIITECTFLGLDEEDTNRAARKKHIVWTELKPIVVSHPHIVFVLIHFSLRHSPKELRSFFKDQKLDNIVVFVEEENSTLVQSHEQDQNLEDY
uniref:Metallo-beta-lactamase domain-containing protein n=1 Tax=Arcella intermedia TaxID=1963864 RepID=A0A6B2L9J8_9EUKA